MDLKDKLNLLWKYILLIVIAYAVFALTCQTKFRDCRFGHDGVGSHHKFYGEKKCGYSGEKYDCENFEGKYKKHKSIEKKEKSE